MKVSTVGLSVPKTFHIDSYENIKLILDKHKFKNYEIYLQFMYAWSGIIYRYKSIDYHDKRFSKSFSKYGDAPPHPQRLVQERELYNFFSNSYSTFDNFAYALYIASHYYCPDKFPIKSESDLINISFYKVKCNFSTAYTDKDITKKIIDINSDDNYKLIKLYRNILSHRCAPGRQIHRANGGKSKPSFWNEEIELSAYLTTNIKIWIYQRINDLLDASLKFLNDFEN